jgi:hypothetical protein
VVLILPLACFGPSRDEVARTRSPDGVIDAIVVETNGGATTSFGYEIDLARAGGGVLSARRVAVLYGAGRSAHASGVNLRWIGLDVLAVEYLDAKSAKLEVPLVSIAGRSISVALAEGIDDPHAPPGGMLYNLRKTSGKMRTLDNMVLRTDRRVR